MLPFFPTPYPDELLYSVCARYHQRSCNSTAKATTRALFGEATACAVVDLPCHLEYMCGLLSAPLNDPVGWINNNTLLPFYAPFLPRKRLNKLIAWMRGSIRGGSIHMSIGHMASSIPSPRYLRYCLRCLEEDAQEYGETYWHRSHQAAGVHLCHKHEEWLIEDDSFAAGKHDFRLAPDKTPPRKQSALEDERNLAHHLSLAQMVGWLLEHHDVHSYGLQALHRKYLHHLQRLGLATFSGRVAQRELVDRFVAFYGETFLRQIHCLVDKDSEDNWLSALVRKPRKASHPVRHFLLINFLGIHPEEFFSDEAQTRAPFGRGPWPCLNPVAAHYKRFVVGQCEITRNSETGAPVGNFVCSCGFGYARTGPDQERTDRFRRGRMLSFGKLWEEELIRLAVNERRSLRSTARALGVDVNTVKSHLSRLTEGKATPISETARINEREERRSRWIFLKGNHSDAGRADLRRMASGDFTWLYRHDKKWLYDNLPGLKPQSQQGHRRVDWAQRDAELASLVPAAAREILATPDKFVRVTIWAIGRKIGTLALLQKKLNVLPATKSALERVVESREAFNLRKIRLSVDALRRDAQPLRSWRVARMANVRPKYLADVEAAINYAESIGG